MAALQKSASVRMHQNAALTERQVFDPAQSRIQSRSAHGLPDTQIPAMPKIHAGTNRAPRSGVCH